MSSFGSRFVASLDAGIVAPVARSPIGASIRVGISLAVILAPAALWRRHVDARARREVQDAITLAWLGLIVAFVV